MLFLTKDYVYQFHHFHDNCRCYHKYNHYRDPLDHSVMVREMEALRKIGCHFQHKQHSIHQNQHQHQQWCFADTGDASPYCMTLHELHSNVWY